MLALGMRRAARNRHEVDADAAQALAKEERLLQVPRRRQDQEGPRLQKDRCPPEDQARCRGSIVEHITSGPMIEFPTARNENHKIIDTTDPAELRNLALWILSL
jgi:cytochrome c